MSSSALLLATADGSAGDALEWVTSAAVVAAIVFFLWRRSRRCEACGQQWALERTGDEKGMQYEVRCKACGETEWKGPTGWGGWYNSNEAGTGHRSDDS